jgi:hypothetical protein
MVGRSLILALGARDIQILHPDPMPLLLSSRQDRSPRMNTSSHLPGQQPRNLPARNLQRRSKGLPRGLLLAGMSPWLPTLLLIRTFLGVIAPRRRISLGLSLHQQREKLQQGFRTERKIHAPQRLNEWVASMPVLEERGRSFQVLGSDALQVCVDHPEALSHMRVQTHLVQRLRNPVGIGVQVPSLKRTEIGTTLPQVQVTPITRMSTRNISLRQSLKADLGLIRNSPTFIRTINRALETVCTPNPHPGEPLSLLYQEKTCIQILTKRLSRT